MQQGRISIGIIAALLAASLVTGARADPNLAQGPTAPFGQLGFAFTYQGQLRSGNATINGSCDIAFRVFDAESSGGQVGATLTKTVVLTGSLFTTALDFGPGVFGGDARWLDLQVRCPAGSGPFAGLAPRQALTAAPYALFSAAPWVTNGGSLSYIAGNVGIGTTAPPQKLSVNGIISTTGGVQFQDGTRQSTAYFRPPQLPGAGIATTLDSTDDVGRYSSITIGPDGLGLISYYDVTNEDLKVFHCANVACTSGSLTTPDSTDCTGQYSAITIGADGLGLISYQDCSNGDLKVFHCANADCSLGLGTSIDTAGTVGQETAITIGADGLGLISYQDVTNADLKVFHCATMDCSSGVATTLDGSANDVGWVSSVTIGVDGLGLISYYDVTNEDLKVFHCANMTCTGGISNTLDFLGTVGLYSSITIGSDGLGLISYNDQHNGDFTDFDLKVFHCANVICSSGTASTVDSAVAFVGELTSITIGADGLGLISYRDGTNGDLKVFHCANLACSSGIASTLDGPDNVGIYTSITIGADGLGLISYYDYTNGDLKVFHCSNVSCAPYTRVGR
ncbi:MAG: hypothetical protein IPO29_18280 [Anaerolineae bacterium]|nr:hypothetical protein [Anaerolineae bacterium]